MRLLLLAPAHASAARGNLVTVARWRRGLAARGHEVRVAVPDEATRACADADLVHAHHAVHCGPAALACGRGGIPVVVSLGGTDLNGGPEGGPDPRAREVFARADRIVGPFREDGERLRAALPGAAPFRRVRRGVELGPEAPPPPGGLLGLMAGGIRRVKGQLDALRWLDAMRSRGLEAELLIAGPPIEDHYFAALERALAMRPRGRYLGILEREELVAALAASDFLLNASLHEGASNALLEALAAGRPVVARHAPGNREMLAPAPASCALLVDDDAGGMDRLEGFLRRLLAADRRELAAAARDFVRREHDPELELDELEAVYRELA